MSYLYVYIIDNTFYLFLKDDALSICTAVIKYPFKMKLFR